LLPAAGRSARTLLVALLVPVGLRVLQPPDAARHDLGERAGAGSAPVEAPDEPPVGVISQPSLTSLWGAKGASFSSPATKRRCHRIADDLALGRVASTDSERHPGGERFDQGQREERHD
jgi:hypothetical protein